MINKLIFADQTETSLIEASFRFSFEKKKKRQKEKKQFKTNAAGTLHS